MPDHVPPGNGPQESGPPPFLPPGFAVPVSHRAGPFVLEPLGPRHNESDHEAWSSSIGHIRATPGFEPHQWGGDEWPYEMSLEANRADLCAHAEEFARREAFAYTVLDAAELAAGRTEVIGCVYIDPDDTAVEPGAAGAAMVRCWVRWDRAALDDELARVVRDWLAADWPLTRVRFPGR